MYNCMCSSVLLVCAFVGCVFACTRWKAYLWGVYSSLLEGAVAGILCAHVAIFAPVAGEVSIDAGQAPAASKERRKEAELCFFVHSYRPLFTLSWTSLNFLWSTSFPALLLPQWLWLTKNWHQAMQKNVNVKKENRGKSSWHLKQLKWISFIGFCTVTRQDVALWSSSWVASVLLRLLIWCWFDQNEFLQACDRPRSCNCELPTMPEEPEIGRNWGQPSNRDVKWEKPVKNECSIRISVG